MDLFLVEKLVVTLVQFPQDALQGMHGRLSEEVAVRVGIVAPHRQLTHHLGAPYHLLTTTIPGLLDRESTIPNEPLAASILAQQTLLCAGRLQPIVRESLLYQHHYPFGAFFFRNSRTACWIKKLTVSPSFLASFLSSSICRALIRTALSFLTITRMYHNWRPRLHITILADYRLAHPALKCAACARRFRGRPVDKPRKSQNQHASNQAVRHLVGRVTRPFRGGRGGF